LSIRFVFAVYISAWDIVPAFSYLLKRDLELCADKSLSIHQDQSFWGGVHSYTCPGAGCSVNLSRAF